MKEGRVWLIILALYALSSAVVMLFAFPFSGSTLHPFSPETGNTMHVTLQHTPHALENLNPVPEPTKPVEEHVTTPNIVDISRKPIIEPHVDNSITKPTFKPLERLDPIIYGDEPKLLIYAPNGQLNNQRKSFMDALGFARVLNRTLVLPYLSFRHNYLQRFENNMGVKTTYVHMQQYFDVSTVQGIKLVRPGPYLRDVCGNIVTLHDVHQTKETNPKKYYNKRLGLKWDIKKHMKTNTKKWNTEAVHRAFGGIQTTCLCLGVLFNDFEHPSKLAYANLRQSIRFASWVMNTARDVRSTLGLNEKPFLALHHRRRPAEGFCMKHQKARLTCTLPPEYVIAKIHEAFTKFKLHADTPIFLASSITNATEVDIIKSAFPNCRTYMPVYTIKQSDDGLMISMIDQLLCSWADFFLGTSQSTFSHIIREERTIVLGKDKGITF